MKDLDDRTRYLLVSVFSPRFVLYYSIPSPQPVDRTPPSTP
jgi:hypothetical protein